MFTTAIFLDTKNDIMSSIGNNTMQNGKAKDAMAGMDFSIEGGNIPPYAESSVPAINSTFRKINANFNIFFVMFIIDVFAIRC